MKNVLSIKEETHSNLHC